MQPAADSRTRHHRSRLADEDEKSRLECILRVLDVAQEPAADAPDHWGVSVHQRREGGVIAVVDETLQHLPVRCAALLGRPYGPA